MSPHEEPGIRTPTVLLSVSRKIWITRFLLGPLGTEFRFRHRLFYGTEFRFRHRFFLFTWNLSAHALRARPRDQDELTAGVHYWECVSYARLRIGVVSQPFCVDQLNPAGFNVFNVPYKENSCFIPTRETGNLKINMAEADLSPTTFTSSSASESDYDISLRIPVIIIIRPRKQCKT